MNSKPKLVAPLVAAIALALGANAFAADTQDIADARKESQTERDFSTAVNDASITAAVKSKLLWNEQTDGLEIDVDTEHGRVTLTGTADTQEAKDMATRLARTTDDVVAVDNRLTMDPKVNVAKPDSETAATDQPVADSWITTKIKATYAYSRWIDGSDIMVDTIEGVVTLSGSTDTRAERELAIELAQNIRGVKQVDASGLKAG